MIREIFADFFKLRFLRVGQDFGDRFVTLERELETREGAYFAGPGFSLVDAVFGPVFRYFDRFDAIGNFGFFDAMPQVQAWRDALAARPSVKAAAHPDYACLLDDFLRARGSELSRRMA